MVPPSESLAKSAHRYAPGDVIAAKYRLEHRLGEGGMGTVWRALNLQLEAPVALKLIRAGLDRELLTVRLKQEARAAAKLGHPAIVRIFDVGESEFGDPFIVMELLTGQSLASLLSKEGRLAAVRTLQLLLPVADALSAAHAKGIIHRDLKPDNVFIAIEDERVQPKLVDFGIVKLSEREGQVDKHLTQAGTVLGSPEYMSPEQARGREDIDHRTDIWSFAVLLYETLAGVTPFAGPSYNALLRSIVEDEPTSLPDQLASDQPLWDIIRRGLAKDLAQRHGSMNEFGRALAGWLLAQGVFEDVAGGSLEAKWIARSNETFAAAKASRASLGSLSGQGPESGVRALSGDVRRAPTLGPSLGNAPTLGLPAPPGSATLTLPSAPIGSRRTVVALGVFLVLALTATLIARRAPVEPAQALPIPGTAPAGPESKVSVVPALPAPVAIAPAGVAPPEPPVAEVHTATTPAKNGHAPAAQPRALPKAAEQPKIKPGNSAADLLTPY